MRFLSVCFFMLFYSQLHSQYIKSPDEFLGYKLGKRFTPHHRIVSYFNEVEKNASSRIKLSNYGTTNEGRELLLAFVSSPENIQRLDEIRKNNLRLSGLLKDMPGNTSFPVVVWLSYNVHGNEASSSEVSMKTLYELVSGKNPQIEKWLKNTIVIIDPCLNPDGRDRYVNWYNQVVGKNAISNILSREHVEPWPGGRTNHYNFDLNRDWAWQTQVETQQRLVKYNEWMPAIHCDFHEQSYMSPYYFAPAAEPYHEVITPWQRQFQINIGKNHAKYFDENGWLYFTKEIFDLFYPSYGDTYPMYNGSIGMTYEQAGLSRAGVAVETDTDTLTLTDRIAHHFTTSMSTIEIASEYFSKINEEYKKYFDGIISKGSGEYKSYVLSAENTQKLTSLKSLFNKNGIEYSYAKKGTMVKGLRYFTGKVESYLTSSSDLIVHTNQTKGVLVKVLFEMESKLSDSATYDITAWSLPFAYGVDCYAVKDLVSGQKISGSDSVDLKFEKNGYAYLLEYESFNGGKFLATLLKNNIHVRYAENDFVSQGKKYKKGTMVILKKDNERQIDLFFELVEKNKISVTTVHTGFMENGFDFGSEKWVLIKKPVVAVLTGESVYPEPAGEIWYFFDQELDYPLISLNTTDLNNINLGAIDVIILPNGNYKNISDKENTLKSWVKQGGKLIAIENAVAQLGNSDWGFKLKNNDVQKQDEGKVNYSNLKRYENRERDFLVNNTPGAIYKVDLDNSNPLAFGYPDFYHTLKMNTHMLEFLKEGWNVGVIKKQNPIAGFVGNAAKELIKDGAIISSHSLGNGTLVCFVDNPVFRSFWENGKLLLLNAVFLVK